MFIQSLLGRYKVLDLKSKSQTASFSETTAILQIGLRAWKSPEREPIHSIMPCKVLTSIMFLLSTVSFVASLDFLPLLLFLCFSLHNVMRLVWYCFSTGSWNYVSVSLAPLSWHRVTDFYVVWCTWHNYVNWSEYIIGIFTYTFAVIRQSWHNWNVKPVIHVIGILKSAISLMFVQILFVQNGCFCDLRGREHSIVVSCDRREPTIVVHGGEVGVTNWFSPPAPFLSNPFDMPVSSWPTAGNLGRQNVSTTIMCCGLIISVS